MSVLDFYGANDPETFAIERKAMDRSGRVIDALDRVLPHGLTLDVGAGDGFTAKLLSTRREIVALEPASGMIDRSKRLAWVQGDAESLPFADGSFVGAYATWAYFFPSVHDVTPGVDELHRVVIPGGPIVVVDNAGGCEFSAMLAQDYSVDGELWISLGFNIETIETAFEFDSTVEADRLMSLFLGRQVENTPTTIAFNVAFMTTYADRSRSVPA